MRFTCLIFVVLSKTTKICLRTSHFWHIKKILATFTGEFCAGRKMHILTLQEHAFGARWLMWLGERRDATCITCCYGDVKILIYIVCITVCPKVWNVNVSWILCVCVVCQWQEFVTALKIQFPNSCCMTQLIGTGGHRHRPLRQTVQILKWLVIVSLCRLPPRFPSGDSSAPQLLEWCFCWISI